MVYHRLQKNRTISEKLEIPVNVIVKHYSLHLTLTERDFVKTIFHEHYSLLLDLIYNVMSEY